MCDFRGYGNSTSVSPDFWNLVDDPLTGLPGHPHNKLLGQSLAMRRPANISATYFPPKYLWALVNDIAAAKVFLDERNDRGDCNSSASMSSPKAKPAPSRPSGWPANTA